MREGERGREGEREERKRGEEKRRESVYMCVRESVCEMFRHSDSGLGINP